MRKKTKRYEQIEHVIECQREFCVKHCPFPNAAECLQCYDSQRPLTFRAVVAEKATEAGFADEDVIAMFKLRPRRKG